MTGGASGGYLNFLQFSVDRLAYFHDNALDDNNVSCYLTDNTIALNKKNWFLCLDIFGHDGICDWLTCARGQTIVGELRI